MPYAVELYFDPDTEAALRTLWRELAEAGVDDSQQANGFRPHVSLAVASKVSTDAFLASLRDYATSTQPFSVCLSSVGLFPGEAGVMFLAPTPTRALLDAHARFHACCSAHLHEIHTYYQPDKWVPHCTLAQEAKPQRAVRGLDVAWGASLPLQGTFVEVGLSSFRPTIVRHLFPLGSPPSETTPP